MNKKPKRGDYRIVESDDGISIEMWDEQPGYTGWFSCDKDGIPVGWPNNAKPYRSVDHAREVIRNNFKRVIIYHEP